MQFVRDLRCVFCGNVYPPRALFTCPRCGPSGILDVEYDYRSIAKTLTRRTLTQRCLNHWRYRELLPLKEDTPLPSLSVCWTPLTETIALARHLGIARLSLKDEGRNATGSLKDRASSLGVAKAREKRCKIIACASTGNAASSLAGMAASSGLRSVIFVPERAPEPKITQLLIFGATVFRVRGGYEDAFRLSQQACDKWGWYNRNSGINPYLVEGKKTCGLELGEQTNWQPPDWVAVSVGDGCTIAGIWKGLREWRDLGFMQRLPKLLGVQAEGAAPITQSFLTGNALLPVAPVTVADSIAVGVPRNWKKAVEAVRESGGTMINVNDDEILEAMRYTGRLSGIFAEPAAATAVAGLHRALRESRVPKQSSAVAVITGNGLKDIRSAQAAVGCPFEIPASGHGLDDILMEQHLVSSNA